ncbi:MAG: hypothetical protein WCP91_03110 [Candidatus Berkelbacteria bacterium]
MSIVFRESDAFWPVFLSSSHPVKRNLLLEGEVVESNCWPEARVESGKFVATGRFWQPESHRAMHFDSYDSLYRRNDPFAYRRALELLAVEKISDNWEYRPAELVAAAVGAVVRDSTFYRLPIVDQLLSEIGDHRDHLMSLPVPDLAELVSCMVQSGVVLCRRSFDLELEAGVIGAKLHRECVALMENYEQPDEPAPSPHYQHELFPRPIIDALHHGRPTRRT